ncbi:hypothetical protein AAFF_G00366070 [Aldrovandia affinis]|uniref:Uncharacterized protein n=1 Tax=Aldrovandia affinis TaxID=143900 RepID=A0AAD7WNH6_9TELE|nr:hypothetical protein AAFF_G00366070 [Aldrovandia affinis]
MPSLTFSNNLSLFVLFLPLSLCFYVPNQSLPLFFDDQVRERHLYTENKRQGLFLELVPDGSVRGLPSRQQTVYWSYGQ